MCKSRNATNLIFLLMEQLTQTELSTLEYLKEHFKAQVGYVDTIIANKFFPHIASDEIDYVIRDNTDFSGGYQNDAVSRWFQDLKGLWQKSKEDF